MFTNCRLLGRCSIFFGDVRRWRYCLSELAKIVEGASDCNFEQEEWSIPCLEKELGKNPEDGINKYKLVFAKDGVWWDKEKIVNERLRMQMMDMETYARKLSAKE
jgi:hypothetical protein